ncbi:hypothetical protein M8C13_07015 [Crossiella sp. SN42]|uniref:hypothetical protein n=1 Tax=Crossiella sp. SN42 TaxID=2944808 RepID=UPI00207CBD95|nr:hypothetical protein [Crossiella sp. SN42]MCO1575507.1 hypothetical protein [Crossiella sp. SN42]
MNFDVLDALPADYCQDMIDKAVHSLPIEDLEVGLAKLDQIIAMVGSTYRAMPMYSLSNRILQLGHLHEHLVTVLRMCREQEFDLPIDLVMAKKEMAERRATAAEASKPADEDGSGSVDAPAPAAAEAAEVGSEQPSTPGAEGAE